MARRVLPGADGAHREIASDGIVPQRDGHVVEVRRLRRPQVQLLRRQNGAAAAVLVRFAAADGRSLIGNFDSSALRRGRGEPPTDASLRQLRREQERLHIVLRHVLGPDGLPDAALRRVPDAAALRLLLAAREGYSVRIVAHGDSQDVFAIPQKLCHIQCKGRIAARVRPGKQAVDVHPCPLVSGSDVQQHPPAIRLCKRQRPPVPEHLTGLQNSAHPGQRRFRRKRHEDLPVPRAGAGVGGRDGVVPEAVKIVIAFPHELRAGIFLQNSVLVQRFAPRCQHFVPSFFLSASTGGRISSSTMAAARKMDGVGTVFTTPRST